MRFMLRSCLTLCTAATLLCGCADPDASANHEARLKFASALEKVEQANRGYTDGSSGQAADLAAFRAGGLAKAAQELSQLLNQGTPGQQSAAARVLGQTYITLSRYQVSTAQQHWEELWYPTTELLAQVNQVTLSQVRAQALENDQTPGLDQLNQYQSRFVKQDEEARRKVEELSKSITQLQASHKDLITRRDALLTKAQSHKDQAFTLSGQAQFETYQSALQTEREAQVLDAQAEKINAELDVQQANLAITQNTGKLAAANVLTIQKQAQALEQRQSEAVAQKQALISDPQNPSSVKAREATLIETITRVTQTFSQKVQPAYDEADKTAAQAVTMLEKALSQTRGDASRQRSIKADLLSAYANRLEVQGRWIAAQGYMARVLVVADTRISQSMTLGDNAQPLRGTISEFQKALTSAIDEAKALKAKTDELAGQLATPGADADVISAFVTTQNQRITQAVGWIEASGM